jgi:ESCRT-II complex subunit VPS22
MLTAGFCKVASVKASESELCPSFYSSFMMARRGVGIGAFKLEKQNDPFQQLSRQISEQHIAHLQDQLNQFRAALANFAANNRENILHDPSFRHAFQQMCSSIGVDPLAGPHKGGWWAEMLGLGDWQHELGVQIVDVCVSTRQKNGGIVEMSELVRLISKLRGENGNITEQDIIRSIDTLRPLGGGYEVIEIERGRKMVRSVVKELDQDQAVILSIAQETGGRVVVPMLVEQKGWTPERARVALENMLMRDGLCWLDDQDEEYDRAYWITSAMQWDD